ncbi:MAG: signal peptidase I [Thermodesulfobacteriota bacterium]
MIPCRPMPLAPLAALMADLTESGCRVRLRATGSSMAPAIGDGDVVIVTPARGGAIRPGDIVAARVDGDRLVIHRVVGVADEDGRLRFALRGDRCAGPPDLVDERHILGKVAPGGCLPRLLARRVSRQFLALARLLFSPARRHGRTPA